MRRLLGLPITTPAAGVPAGKVSLLDRVWQLSPGVSVRPESFGALLYHFGTRRLSFLKDPRLLAVVQRLDTAPDARTACAQAELTGAELPAYDRALSTLASTDMIRERP